MGVLTQIQSELKAPKNQRNNFGNYNYRSCEDILEALKPILKEHNADLILSDEVVEVGGRIYIKATANFKAGDETAIGTGFAREAETKKGMDESQITGTASSYARKYALNGLFLIDDSKDADTNEYRNIQQKPLTPEAMGMKKASQAKRKGRFSDSEILEMGKWQDGTFTADELAKIKAELNGDGWAEAFNKAKAEYDKRKAGNPPEEIF